LRDLLGLQERMNRLFEESLARERPDEPGVAAAAWSPAVDVYETESSYVVEVEVPGLLREDVEVRADVRELTVRGERRARAPERPEAFQRMERSYGAFQRAFRFERQVVPERVAADLRDGLLRIELPKATSARRVAVSRP
jgi:HSP20 family protein